MKKYIIGMSFLLITASSLLMACKKTKAGETNDKELITTMILKFTPIGGGTGLSYSFNDPDGPGGIAPTQDVIRLNASKSYNVAIELLNVTTTPPTNITTEIMAEAIAHRFYYALAGNTGIIINDLNKDPNGDPLGTTSTWITADSGNGTLKVTLRHYPGTPPNKAASDAADSPKSTTDIEVTFATLII